MIKLDTQKYKTQQERSDYVSCFDLTEYSPKELEIITDYILNGAIEESESKNSLPADKLEKKMIREQQDIAGENITDQLDWIETTTTEYKPKTHTITKKDIREDSVIAEYQKLYEYVSAKLKEKPDSLWRVYSNTKHSVMDDMKLTKEFHKGSFSCKVAQPKVKSNTVKDFDLTDKNTLVNLLRTAPKQLETDNDYFLDYLMFEELLMSKWNEFTDREQRVVSLMRQGYSSKEIADIVGCSGRMTRRGHKTYVEKVLDKLVAGV